MPEKRRLENFIGGDYVESAAGRYYELTNPATGEPFAEAPLSGREDVDRAFAAAQKAFEGWRYSTPSERQLALLRIADR
ncbi:MAG: aldehyde dehydrogenase family protein, partial [Rubrobacteraceae bacterium]|nr:aldehyde dehydrogenase family protein [Rubrobacteraceae bacterium]